MWGNSKPAEYLSFRVFIFGITNQSMFPNGVVYDGVENNNPLNFRGESGANDSIVSINPEIPIRLQNFLTKLPVNRFPSWIISARSQCQKHP